MAGAMRILILLLILPFALVADEPKLPPLPKDVTLANGFVMRNASVVRWENDKVVLKYTGGVAPVRYTHLSAKDRPIFDAHHRDSANNAVTKPAASSPEKKRYAGQVFVQTNDQGPMKMGSLTVYVFPVSEYSKLDPDKWTYTRLSKPLLTAVTDVEGKFEFDPPSEDFFIFTQASRRFYGPTRRESGRTFDHDVRPVFYRWRLKSTEIDDPKKIAFGNHNMTTATSNNIEIDK